jgi:RNase H-like domain found in reverse transcriptase/Reverse transcriptase (RNA-dependent DNA polymerase)
MKSGYLQIGLDDATKLKTAFSTRYSHYHWNVLPFGLTNGVMAYQHRMNFVLAKYLDKFVIVYLDDTMIFSETLEEYEEHVKAVLETWNEVGMILNLEKCQFLATEVKFLGHIVTAEGIRPDPANITKVLEWPTPRTTITDVRGFNNLANHYAWYIENFAGLALPLTDLQKGSPPKGAAIEWTPDCQEAFDKIKTAITTSPVLKRVDMSKPFVLDPDASQFRIGAVLQQYFEDSDGKQRLHPVAFESKKLTLTEQRYSSQERELLAAKCALNH